MYKAIRIIGKEKRWLLIVLLLVGFVLSFSIPLLFSKIIWHASNTVGNRPALVKGFITSYKSVIGLNRKIHITSANSLSPEKNKDFLLVSWVKLGRKIQESEQLVFLGKYNKDTEVKPGYAIALRKRGEDIHPLVYWNNHENQGRWYSFSAIEGIEKSWVMFALSFTEGKFLGLHAISTNSEDRGEDSTEVELLGGYKLEEEIIPNNNEKLYLGSIGDTYFKGRFGPIGVFSAKDMGESINEIITKLSLNPETLPESIDKDSVKLWSINLKQDLSPFKAKISHKKQEEKKK